MSKTSVLFLFAMNMSEIKAIWRGGTQGSEVVVFT